MKRPEAGSEKQERAHTGFSISWPTWPTGVVRVHTEGHTLLFNTRFSMLMVVLGNAELCRGVVSPDQPMREWLDQVLVNLLVNARDAIIGTGRISLSTENVTIDPDYSLCHVAVASGDYVMLSVSDTGLGMDEATRARVFEPFFTTKDVGQGTGLGLATVHGIVRQNNGHESVRTMCERFLEKSGYVVISAESPEQSLDIGKQPQAHIDLLLTDVIMPGTDGRELARRIGEMQPAMKVLFMSGYPSEIMSGTGRLTKEAAFLSKPFSRHDLNDKVRTVLNNGTANANQGSG